MLNFIILSIGHSGTHMLASALNRHPEICCMDEFGYDCGVLPAEPNGKPVLGRIINYRHREKVPENCKVIRLIRDNQSLAEAYARQDEGLTRGICFEPTAVRTNKKWDKEDPGNNFDVMNAELNEISARHEKISVNYDEITGNADCRVIPDLLGNDLCSFLGVDKASLKPTIYKRTVSHIENLPPE